MLDKKQYWMTLLLAVFIFFILFIATYFYEMSLNTGTSGTMDLEQSQKAAVVTNNVTIPKPECILPSTRITLKTFNQNDELLETIQLNSVSLLGLTEEEFKERFKDYAVEVFSEECVALVKNIEVKPEEEQKELTNQEGAYVLGVEADEVCIKLKGNQKALMTLNRKATDFSSYIYSLLLKESIVLTQAQKDMLMEDVGALEKILQDYIGE